MNAAMKEFAQNGFKNASTDAIVKEAAISKGALFHYFNNKKDLFLFLYDYTMDIIKDEIVMKFNRDEKDVFARIRQSTLLKIEIIKKHPKMYDFIISGYMEDSPDVKNDIEKRNHVLIAYGQSILNDGVDISRFREDIDAKKAIDIIIWTIESFSNRQLHRVKSFSLYEQNFDQLIKELDEYLDTMRKCFYKYV